MYTDESMEIPTSEGWKYYNGKVWKKDPTMRVEDSKYIERLVVSSSGGALRKYPNSFGVYELTKKMYYGRPVFKHASEQLYLFFNSYKHWTISTSLNPTKGNVYTDESKEIPTSEGWKYWNSKVWKEDPTMRVEGNHQD